MSKNIVLSSYLNLPKLSTFTITFLISLSVGLISTANAQEEDYRKPAERKIKVPFFEEERKLNTDDAFSSFSNTFLNDALGGTGDPMGGGTVPGSDFTMSPNVSDSEFTDPTRGVPSRGGVTGSPQPSGGPSPVSPTPINGGGRGIFQNLPPR
ncbi:hypothetical protein [Dapis sp. BLCC M229]|uniref:hypothetical protein n=1 Tax=Dapis sp. BLCC M229 TaxID=3400188 RepID=UPI003CF5168B